MKKEEYVGISFIIIIIGIILSAVVLIPNNSSWQSTIEDAWENGRTEFEKDETEVFQQIDLIYYDTEAVLIFLTKDGDLIEANFEFSKKKEKWHCYSIGRYGALDMLEETCAQYEADGDRLYHMLNDQSTLSGIRYHDGEIPYLNGIKANVHTYLVEFNGNAYQIDYWDILNLNSAVLDEFEVIYL